ncbi:MAG: glycosyltransferase family 2 protein [Rhodospirillaceae bacterium]
MRFTIITPVLNRAGMIAQALDSVARQGYPGVEHIVIDGGSTDGTVDILKRSPGIHWISEPDSSRYEAINKGIQIATGDVIGHLNSNDILLPGALAGVADGFATDRSAEAACGGAQVARFLTDGTISAIKVYNDELIKRLDWHCVAFGEPISNARFFRRSWYRRAGLYNLHYKLAADRDFLIRSLILNIHTVAVERIVYQYRIQPCLPNTEHEVPHHCLHDEYLTIAHTYMTRSDIPEPLRRMAYRWFVVESMRRLGFLAGQRNWAELNRSLWVTLRGLTGRA